ncbi:MAG TPA: IS200/IS605 family transposase [Phycisphaerales bacterium]|jgi:REP element-mobilizing transposase RayT|nr:IS200/IS605 family transposase [Phycisphaerales bacterium]
MPSSWTQNYYHAVWGTKGREPWISAETEERLHALIGGILKDQKCTPIAINGMHEHVHALFRFSSDRAISDIVRHVKSRSSGWIHDTFAGLKGFDWQNGYGGFTVSKSLVDEVAAYIRNQKEHHTRMSFRDEYLAILRKTGWEGSDDEAFQ